MHLDSTTLSGAPGREKPPYRFIGKVKCTDRAFGEQEYEIRILHLFGKIDGYLTPDKVRELWVEASKHKVLFSDFTDGKIEPFLAVLHNPASIWLEIFRVGDQKSVGVAYITRVIPHFDAQGHFAFWDSIASGREPIIWKIMDWLFAEFDLRRISAATPPTQGGVIRFIKRLGFMKEGEKREAVLYKGRWFPMVEFGILRNEFEEIRKVFFAEEGR